MSKRIEELGITPAPWSAEWEGPWSHMVWSGRYPDKTLVATMQGNTRRADSALIAAAPALYAALREAVVEMCHNCEARRGGDVGECERKAGGCSVQRWRDALGSAEAAK